MVVICSYHARIVKSHKLCQLMISIVLAGFLLNGNKSKYCVLPDPCAGIAKVPGAGCARLTGNEVLHGIKIRSDDV